MTSAAAASPLAEAVARVGDRWTLLVIEALMSGSRRFSELASSLEGIAPNILSQRLKHLEAHALVVARPYSRRPPRVSYELTAAGLELAGALRLLAQWGARRSDAAAPPRHDLCGTALEVRWYCPSCERALEDSAEDELHYL
jgi:DNA-binding HxlR family transcriptional regulator